MNGDYIKAKNILDVPIVEFQLDVKIIIKDIAKIVLILLEAKDKEIQR